ncbi:LAMI_0E10704g1_1 [Lachancea mirantina]|uniref:Altered inheritance of mitochondria protein 9, mitochondrial n=1 Tax=Lachancea mirantina TaxID=1230905 RepID=A0A1G4JP35_9SACH|nr:LAMI_0E10704g1_1 [Lachancea mirantina]
MRGSLNLRLASGLGRVSFAHVRLNRPGWARFSSSKPNDKPEETFTKLSDENDPQRNAFFQYSWGSWLKNDKLEKSKRETRFSIEGLNDVLSELYNQSRILAKSEEAEIPPPKFHRNLTVTLPHNLSVKNIGVVNPNEKVQIKTMASIHEGKHHRIYKIDTNAGKPFILRIPYALDGETNLAERLKSEVATMDFADLKLGLKVPKVYCYAAYSTNPIRQPFILEEFIEGELLMRQWSPLEEDAADGKSHIDKLNKVIEPLSEFQSRLLETEFTSYGSLYFAKDFSQTNEIAYEGETRPDLKNRWRVGPSTERCYWNKGSALSTEALKKFTGPWKADQPTAMIKALAELEVESAKARLALIEAGSSPEVADKSLLENQIRTYEDLAKASASLFNTNSSAIPNIKELFKPRLYHPDLDPMNMIVGKDGTSYLLDFESCCIKPFILQNCSQYVAYDGPKIYDLKEDVEGYEELNDAQKEQYKFMYKRTRNQHLWEAALNKNQSKLISAVAPPIKLLRCPYINCIERKNDDEYLLVEEALVQLKEVWDVFAKNKLVNAPEFPISYSDKQLEHHTNSLNSFHEKLISSPFAATQGWIPQDMFDNLVKAEMLVKDKDGNYAVNIGKQ